MATTAPRRHARATRTAPQRDTHGRFKPNHRTRNLAIGTATAVGAIGAGIAAALRLGLLDRFFPATDGAEHAAPDLALDAPRPGTIDARAPDAFRPDPTASVPVSERDALRPATIDRGFTTEDRSVETAH